jgi:succinyl-CoA synthetase alpha subunit
MSSMAECPGLASRSGTISYELAAQASALGLGQSVVFGLGGDPFPGTRTWEALRFMLDDPLTKIICLVGEVGGQSGSGCTPGDAS